MNRKFLYYLTAFAVGYVTLSLELLGFRLFAPYFGYSVYVSGALIGTVLLALSLGYSFGGYVSDRGVEEKFTSKILLISSLYLLVIFFFRDALLAFFADYSIVYGSILSTLVFFAPPMTLLASLSPYFIKVLSSDRSFGVGFSSGTIYTVSTVGSIAGTFLTSFYLVPEHGANTAFATNLIILFSFFVFWFTKKIKIAAILIFSVLFGVFYAKTNAMPVPNVIEEKDSAYSRLEVVKHENFLGLRTDRRNNLIYSLYPENGVWKGNYMFYHFFAVPPIVNNAKTALLLGLGAGTIPFIHSEFNPELSITGVEIDPEIVRLGEKYFGLSERANTKIIIDDARPFLSKNTEKYDLIEMDLFSGSGEIPFYLATKEFFTLIRGHLSQNGILSINVYDPSEDMLIAKPLINTVASVYKHAYAIHFSYGSHFIMGTDVSLNMEKVSEWSKKTPHDERFDVITGVFKYDSEEIAYNPKIRVFTDNLSPLEKLSFEAIFKTR